MSADEVLEREHPPALLDIEGPAHELVAEQVRIGDVRLEESPVTDGVVVLEARLANSQPIDGLWGNTTTEFIETQIENLRSIGTLNSDLAPTPCGLRT